MRNLFARASGGWRLEGLGAAKPENGAMN